MLKLKPFQEKTYTAGASYDSEFSGLAVGALGFTFDATVAGAATNIPTDGSFVLLGSPEVNQSENPLIRMAGSSWRLLSAFQRGSFDVFTASASAAQAVCTIDLQRLMRGGMINAADKKAFFRGSFAALASYTVGGTAPTGVTGTLRPFVLSSDLDPTQGFLRPKFTQASVPLANQDNLQGVFKFEQDTVVSAIMIEAFDDSAKDRVDGMIRTVRIDHVGDGGTQEIVRARWGVLRKLSAARAGFDPTNYALAAGAVLIPLIDRRNPQFNNAVLFRAGDSLTISYDCSTNLVVEESFSSTTAASPDVARTTILGWTPVAGTGDAATQVRSISSGAGAAVAAVKSVSARDARAMRRAAKWGAQ